MRKMIENVRAEWERRYEIAEAIRTAFREFPDRFRAADRDVRMTGLAIGAIFVVIILALVI